MAPLPRYQLFSAVLCLWYAVLAPACIYDHRVTQAIQERNRRAREAEGAKVHAAGGSNSMPVKRFGQVRFYVAADYRKQHADWRHDLEDLVEAANAVIRPGFAMRLEVAELHAWDAACNVIDLGACLVELEKLAASGDTEWVVGVVGAVPRFTASFDELGLASVPGRHFMIREVADLAERDAIDRAFPSLTPARRAEIYAKRKQHKRTAVFLHEWGHSLGALHTLRSDAILHPSYDDRMASFDVENAALISAALDDAFAGKHEHAELIAALEKSEPASFELGARDALLAQLRSRAASPVLVGSAQGPESASKQHPYVVQGEEAKLLAGVDDGSRALYRQSVALLNAGEDQRALQNLAPLFDQYPDCYALQHLGCGLTMQLGHGDMQKLCARAQRLMSKPP